MIDLDEGDRRYLDVLDAVGASAELSAEALLLAEDAGMLRDQLAELALEALRLHDALERLLNTTGDAA